MALENLTIYLLAPSSYITNQLKIIFSGVNRDVQITSLNSLKFHSVSIIQLGWVAVKCAALAALR